MSESSSSRRPPGGPRVIPIHIPTSAEGPKSYVEVDVYGLVVLKFVQQSTDPFDHLTDSFDFCLTRLEARALAAVLIHQAERARERQ